MLNWIVKPSNWHISNSPFNLLDLLSRVFFLPRRLPTIVEVSSSLDAKIFSHTCELFCFANTSRSSCMHIAPKAHHVLDSAQMCTSFGSWSWNATPFLMTRGRTWLYLFCSLRLPSEIPGHRCPDSVRCILWLLSIQPEVPGRRLSEIVADGLYILVHRCLPNSLTGAVGNAHSQKSIAIYLWMLQFSLNFQQLYLFQCRWSYFLYF